MQPVASWSSAAHSDVSHAVEHFQSYRSSCMCQLVVDCDALPLTLPQLSSSTPRCTASKMDTDLDLTTAVSAARAGGFESGFNAPAGGYGGAGGGQTREHAQLAKSLGVDQLAVVVTKLDACDFDAHRFEHIR